LTNRSSAPALRGIDGAKVEMRVNDFCMSFNIQWINRDTYQSEIEIYSDLASALDSVSLNSPATINAAAVGKDEA
jgi:hypothetical protein